MEGEIDEVRGLRCEEEADVGVVDGLAADAVVGEAVLQRDALKGVPRTAEGSREDTGGEEADEIEMT